MVLNEPKSKSKIQKYWPWVVYPLLMWSALYLFMYPNMHWETKPRIEMDGFQYIKGYGKPYQFIRIYEQGSPEFKSLEIKLYIESVNEHCLEGDMSECIPFTTDEIMHVQPVTTGDYLLVHNYSAID